MFYILECPGGSFGQDCLEVCGGCKSKTTCNATTGICPDGCNNGFEGSHCKPVLTPGTVSLHPFFTENWV